MSNATAARPLPQRSLSARLFEWLGSMSLAVTLLIALALASVIGTVLQQNQPYNAYLAKFGPFWFEVFRVLGLYDVYGAAWFIVILVFLVTSTSICVWRNAPRMLRDMRELRTGVQENSLRNFRHHAQWTSATDARALAPTLAARMSQFGYRTRMETRDEHTVIAARKGGLNRLGYIFTHVGIVVICLGGLLDSKLYLQWREATGALKVETRDISASEVPPESRLPPGNPSFRGNVNVSEGGQSKVLFLNVRDGYVVQELPFSIELKDFRIEHYDNGQPKSFESDLLIHDPEHLNEPLAKTIAVNHPLIYRGFAIYQANFGDGGSKIPLRAWQLIGEVGKSQEIEGAVFKSLGFGLMGQKYTIEISDFRLFNINPMEGKDGQIEQKNFGPSVVFRLRDEAGQAREYENYLAPVPMNGHSYFLSGMRERIGQPMRFLYIPADRDGRIEGFMGFLARLHDREKITAIVEELMQEMRDATPDVADKLDTTARDAIVNVVDQFLAGGFDAIGRDIEARVPEAQRQAAMDTTFRVLQSILGRLYIQLHNERGWGDPTEDDARFLEDAVNAINGLSLYGSPLYLQMTGFTQIQASGLQITRSPGKDVVYFGSLLLTLGVFMMFYIHHRRQWVLLKPGKEGTLVLLAGTDSRRSLDFEREFEALRNRMNETLSNSPTAPSSPA